MTTRREFVEKLCADMREQTGPDHLADMPRMMNLMKKRIPGMSPRWEDPRVGDGATRRIVLTEIHNSKFDIVGVVIEYPSWRVLVFPPPRLDDSRRVPKRIIVENFKNLDVFKVHDGTITTLYYYGGTWCMATANGWDVSEYKWMGQTTFKQALTRAIGARGGADPFADLNTAFYYTIGFRFHGYHPQLNDPEHVWMISTNAADAIPWCAVENPVVFADDDPARRYTAMVKNCRRALQDFNATQGTNNGVEINYGYVVRGRNGARNINVIFESSLLGFVREMVYSVPRDVPASHKAFYIALRAFVIYDARETFVRMFKQYESTYTYLQGVFKLVIDRAIQAIKFKDIADDVMANVAQTPTDALVAIVMPGLGKINPYDEHARAFVEESIYSTDYLIDYFKHILPNE